MTTRRSNHDDVEKEHLLPSSENFDELRKSSSRFTMRAADELSVAPSTSDIAEYSHQRKDSRFKVSLADGESTGDIAEADSRAKSTSEPPAPSPSFRQHKVSSVGRFEVNGSASAPSTKSDAETEDDEVPEVLPFANSKRGVHFIVGARNDKVAVEDADEANRAKSPEHRNSDTIQQTHQKSFRNMKTLDRPPIMDFYRNSFDVVDVNRPSIKDLLDPKSVDDENSHEIQKFKDQAYDIIDPLGDQTPSKLAKLQKPKDSPQSSAASRTKFGWVEGVFVRCLLNIFGVMLYLRISWVAGQAGIGLGSLIVILAAVVTTITALSTCAICTNGEVKGGGAYFLISRSLGPEFGGSIGLIFCVANAVGAAMYVVGFAETIRDILVESGSLDEFIASFGAANIVRVIGILTSLALLVIVFIGTSFESKMQLILLFILLASIVNYFIGAFIPPGVDVQVRGGVGFSLYAIIENFGPEFRGETFFTVFSIYFPAATGIMAGANISGDLADPQKAIPLGTLLAIFATSSIYLFVVFLTGATNVRDADGINVPIFENGTFVSPNCTFTEEGCKYGLMNFFQIIEMESLWGPLITAGIVAATLSSALASLVSAPKVFQAVCKDKLFPKIGYFGKGYGKDEEPRRAYILCGVIAVAVCCIGDLNAIAPIISNFFLASYALLNYACFDQSFAQSPGFRPGFKYYNMWVSLGGSLLCIGVMFIISWVTALLTFFFFGILYFYLMKRKPDVNWGSSTQAHNYRNAMTSMLKLTDTEDHVKNYRPQLLVLAGNPAARQCLVDFVSNITKGNSLIVFGYVVPYAPCSHIYSILRKLERQLTIWLKKRHIKAFYTSVANPSLREGVRSIYQLCGLGKLRPNVVIMGFKHNWAEKGADPAALKEMNEYLGLITDAFELHMGVGVLRNGMQGLDHTDNLKILDPKHEEREEKRRASIANYNAIMRSECSTPHSDANVQCTFNVQNETARVKTPEPMVKFTAKAPEQEEDWPDDASSSGSAQDFPFDFDFDDSDFETADSEDEIPQPPIQNRPRRFTADKLDDIEGGQELKTVKVTTSIRRRGHRNHRQKNQPHLPIDLERFSISVQDTLSRRATVEQRAVLQSLERFKRKVRNGVIDVWWLYDDGGLTLLIPHLLSLPKSYLEGSKLRVFTLSMSSRAVEAEHRGMVALLSKFRIDFSDVSVIADIGKKPQPDTIRQWEDMIQPFMAPEGEEDVAEGLVTQSEIKAQHERTHRQLRISELLQQHSVKSDLIILTLPVPRKGMVSSSMYLSWLDMMTRNLPPCLLVRGNQQSVLTFYS